jgi:hypothetical protein
VVIDGFVISFKQHHRMWDFKFSRRRVWCSELSSGLYCRVVVLMMAAVRTSETSMHFTKTTLHYIPEGCHLYSFILSWLSLMCVCSDKPKFWKWDTCSKPALASIICLYSIHPSNGATTQIGPWPPQKIPYRGICWGSVTITFYGVRLLASRPTPVNFGGPMIFYWGLLP